jgi:hypothetical protein
MEDFVMKRMATIVVTLMAASVIVLAQQRGGPPPPPPPLEPGASQADVDKALLAMPPNPNLKNQATVIKWAPDHTYTTLRKGTNNMVCYDRSGFPVQQAFSVECTMLGNLDRVKQNMTVEAEAGDRAKAEAQFAELEKSGKRVKPEFGSVFYHWQGPDQDRARGHMTIAVPGATTATLGLPDSGRGGGVWIMNAGTTTAHLMVPGE